MHLAIHGHMHISVWVVYFNNNKKREKLVSQQYRNTVILSTGCSALHILKTAMNYVLCGNLFQWSGGSQQWMHIGILWGCVVIILLSSPTPDQLTQNLWGRWGLSISIPTKLPSDSNVQPGLSKGSLETELFWFGHLCSVQICSVISDFFCQLTLAAFCNDKNVHIVKIYLLQKFLQEENYFLL